MSLSGRLFLVEIVLRDRYLGTEGLQEEGYSGQRSETLVLE